MIREVKIALLPARSCDQQRDNRDDWQGEAVKDANGW